MNSSLPPFLRLPTELRLLIYGFALHDAPAITIGTAELAGSNPDIVHRLYGGKRGPYPGIPHKHEPVVETTYSASLLSVTNPAVIPLSPGTMIPPEEPHSAPHTAHLSLLLVNKLVNEELASHFKIAQNRNTSIFASYPHGLHVLQTVAPQIIHQAQSVHLAGVYVSKTIDPARAACLGSRQQPSVLEQKLNADAVPDSAAQLGSLVSSLLGPTPVHRIQKLELRVYYPGDDSYSTVWGDDSSPTVVALRNIYNGEIGIEVWRGQKGTGVYLTAKQTGERKRIVSTVWRRLEEGRRGQPKCGTWVVDPRWPNWEVEYEMSDGPGGDTVVSVPAQAQ